MLKLNLAFICREKEVTLKKRKKNASRMNYEHAQKIRLKITKREKVNFIKVNELKLTRVI